MLPDSRLEQLRRRVRKDPASILFAQLADECRRAGLFDEAIDVCRAGLAHHPAYISARVTLGRSLAGLGRWAAAQRELQAVLRVAPEHLAAMRGLAEVYHRRGSLADALTLYRSALALAPDDAELDRLAQELSGVVEAPPAGGEAEPAPRAEEAIRHMDHRALLVIARLEQWLVALHGIRSHDRA